MSYLRKRFHLMNRTSKFQWIVWPIKDVKNVNKRRKQAGFENTVEENAKRLGAEYRPSFTVEEVNDLRTKNRD